MVELSRKLVLAGLVGLVGRGSVAQTVMCTLISFAFFALSFKAQPFHSRTLNFIKLWSEFQIFGIFLVCVVIQTVDSDFSTEVITIDGYGAAQVGLTLMIVPITIYFVVINFRDLKGDTGDQTEDSGAVANPLNAGDTDGSTAKFPNPVNSEGNDEQLG